MPTSQTIRCAISIRPERFCNASETPTAVERRQDCFSPPLGSESKIRQAGGPPSRDLVELLLPSASRRDPPPSDHRVSLPSDAPRSGQAVDRLDEKTGYRRDVLLTFNMFHNGKRPVCPLVFV